MNNELKINPNVIHALGGRKFLATIACGFATSLLTWFDKIDSGTFAVVIVGTVGTFIGGNVYSKFQAGLRNQDD